MKIEDLIEMRQTMEYPIHSDSPNKILYNLNFVFSCRADIEGIVKIKFIDTTYLSYIKDRLVIAAVNIDNLEDYEHQSRYRSSYLNVLFRELGSTKVLKSINGDLPLAEDSLYNIGDNDTCEYDWELIKKNHEYSDDKLRQFIKNKKERNSSYPRIHHFALTESGPFDSKYVDIRWLKDSGNIVIGACCNTDYTNYDKITIRDFFNKLEITKDECLKAFD